MIHSLHHRACFCVLVLSVFVWLILFVVSQRSPSPEDNRGGVISLCVIGRSSHSLHNFLVSLNRAYYPRHSTVHLTVVVSLPSLVLPIISWTRGSYHVVQNVPRVRDGMCTVIFDDSMEVSPIFSYWYMDACARDGVDVVAGGFERVGLAFMKGNHLLHRFRVANFTSKLVELVEKYNMTVRYPSELDEGYVYVRAHRQNPMMPERVPRLQRILDGRYLA